MLRARRASNGLGRSLFSSSREWNGWTAEKGVLTVSTLHDNEHPYYYYLLGVADDAILSFQAS